MVYRKRKFFFILFLFSLIIISIAIYVINDFGLKTIEIEKTILEYGMNVNALIIQKEDIVYFNGKNNLEMEIQEGTKKPLESIIANTKNSVFYNQDALNIEIINWKLENELYQEKLMFEQDLDKIHLEIKNIEVNIEKEKKLNNDKQIKSLENKKDQLLYKKQVIEGSFRFTFLDRSGLEDIKSKLLNNKSNENIIKGQISLKDIGINYPSYIYFQKDGLESLLHSDLLGEINLDYYNEVEDIISKGNKSDSFENHQVVKAIDDTNLFLVIKVPKKFLSEEEKNLKIMDDINEQWQKNGQSSIYEFIGKRRDILKKLPEIKLEWEGKIIKGILIDSNHDDSKEEKIITLKINSQNHKLIGKRKIEIYIYDNIYKGFIIQNKSIIHRDGKDGVILLGKANEEIFTEVFIKNKTDEFVVLDPEENTKLKPGNKILSSPK